MHCDVNVTVCFITNQLISREISNTIHGRNYRGSKTFSSVSIILSKIRKYLISNINNSIFEKRRILRISNDTQAFNISNSFFFDRIAFHWKSFDKGENWLLVGQSFTIILMLMCITFMERNIKISFVVLYPKEQMTWVQFTPFIINVDSCRTFSEIQLWAQIQKLVFVWQKSHVL